MYTRKLVFLIIFSLVFLFSAMPIMVHAAIPQTGQWREAQEDVAVSSPVPPTIYLPLAQRSGSTACGVIPSNTTWDIAGSPYLVQCDVIVPVSTTLTIEAGVTVQFENQGDDLIITGTLQAAGTEFAPIHFKPWSAAEPGSWGQVAFMPGSSGLLDRAVLEYGGSSEGMVYIASDAVQVLNSIVQYSANRGIVIAAASPQISATHIQDNAGGGMYNDSGSPSLRGNTFFKNTAYQGGGLYNGSGSPTIENNIFYYNTAGLSYEGSGGGLFNDSGNPIIQNNTFYQNTAKAFWEGYEWIPGYGGGVYNASGSPIIRSNILANNSALLGMGVANLSLVIPVLDYNDLWNNDYYGMNKGTHDIFFDPQMVNPTSGDFHLAPGSPCIDAGDPDHHPDADFGGDPRPMGLAPDIGAYESLALRVAKSSLPEEALPGATVTYTVSLVNRLSFPLTNALLTDTLPVQSALTGFQADGLSCTHDGSTWGGQLICTLDGAPLAPGDSRTLILTALLTDTLPIPQYVVNPIQVTASAGADTYNASDRARTWVSWCAVQLNDTWMGSGLQEALDASTQTTDVVKVSGYCQIQDLNLDKTLTLQGGWNRDFSDWDSAVYTTTLDANRLGRVMGVEGEVSPMIEGFVITGGKSDLGGGIYISSGNPRIQNNIFLLNSAGGGGGIFIDSGSPTIQANTFENNLAYHGGGLGNHSNGTIIQDNQFTNNTTVGSSNSGGGLFNISSSPTIQGNTFTNNRAEGWGGTTSYGGGLHNDSGNPTIQNNSFIGNRCGFTGGGLNNASGNPDIQNNHFVNNYAGSFGGGLHVETGNPLIKHNTFTGNEATFGGGLSDYNAAPTIDGNTFTNNLADGGSGLYNYFGGPSIQNNIFYANQQAAFGGGIDSYGGNPLIQNNTFSDNSANYGSAISISSGTPVIRNNIITNNKMGAAIQYFDYDPLILDYNDLWNNESGDYAGVSPGEHNIYADPLLVNPASGDFHLASGSPCIDKGDPVYHPATDFEGDARPQGTAPDIGADEFMSPP